MKRISMGILAHVDAGKTTLNESFLYYGGTIRNQGRVDHRDSYLDFDSQERDRGITIYSKTALFNWKDTYFTIVDTPGHTDFSAEMERTLPVLDIAILVISGLDGVQSHTETIFKLLDHYHIPAFIFINKMDITTLSQQQLMDNLNKHLKGNFILFDEDKEEKIALTDEQLLDKYMADGHLSEQDITKAIYSRSIFPCFFGSALKNKGVEELLNALNQYTIEKEYPKDFGFKIFKISYDDDGTRLCYGKVTGGTLFSKQKLSEEEKIDQIRLVNGQKYTLLPKAEAGTIVALKGLNGYVAGQGLGFEKDSDTPVLTAYMNYQVVYPRGTDTNMLMKQLQMLSQEDPQVNVTSSEDGHIQLQLMGEIQIEVIKNVILKRTGVNIDLVNGRVLYRETILDSVIGIGHFEPLRHYAEVHLRLEPLPAGSGMVFSSAVSTDILSLNWQRLVLTHLQEKQHRGVLTGNPITDIKITLIAGRASLKHTEGGDFRQATYRAVRQGLKKASSIVLEPYYNFTITVDAGNLSKVIYDLENMECQYAIGEDDEGRNVITGTGPVSKMQNYQLTLLSHSNGKGKFSASLAGYQPCKNQQEVIDMFGYDSELDMRNPTGSVFCAHGAGFYVPYYEVEDYMDIQETHDVTAPLTSSLNKLSISEQEANAVFNAINGRNHKEKEMVKHQKPKDSPDKVKVNLTVKKERLLMVDGYNVMHVYAKTKELMNTAIDSARDLLARDLSNYGGYHHTQVMLVFDAYRYTDKVSRVIKNGGITIVYTKNGQTADSYIEKAVEDYKKDYTITVATSDMAVQNMAFGSGALRISSTELSAQLENMK